MRGEQRGRVVDAACEHPVRRLGEDPGSGRPPAPRKGNSVSSWPATPAVITPARSAGNGHTRDEWDTPFAAAGCCPYAALLARN